MTAESAKKRTDPNDWSIRQDELFYHVVAILGRRIAPRAASAIDIGAGQAEVLTWLDHIPYRVALDRRSSYAAPGVQSIIADFMGWRPDRKYDLALCLQSLDRFKDPEAAAKRLMKAAKIVIVSLTKTLANDRQAADLVTTWFGREPNYSYECGEITSDMARMIFVYDQTPFRWISIADRSRQSRLQSEVRTAPADAE